MRVLHITYTFAPDPIGGTEVYVSALCRELGRLGIRSAVLAPGLEDANYEIGGIEIRRLGIQPVKGAAEGVPNFSAANAFRKQFAKLRPDIVHLHARSSVVSQLLLQAAREVGASTVFTYHTPTVSCMRGTMMLRGETPCDGHLETIRCTTCVLRKHGLVGGLDRVLANIPPAVGHALESARLRRGPFLALRMRQIVDTNHRNLRELFEQSDRIVAVSEWVHKVLQANGVTPQKLVMSRQGLADSPEIGLSLPTRGRQGDYLQIGFFGRLDPTKGVDALISAVRSIPKAKLALNLFGISQGGGDDFVCRLRRLIADDCRVQLHNPLPSDKIVEAMRRMDLVAVPSVWLETGPLVVLEAFAAGTPVLGSNLGGIAELVTENVDGRLLPPNDASAWAAEIDRLSADRSEVERLRSGVRPPRGMRDAAEDMAGLYRALLNERTKS